MSDSNLIYKNVGKIGKCLLSILENFRSSNFNSRMYIQESERLKIKKIPFQ